ncbi:MAG TPA: hypothetical protein PKM88_15240, partial [bacterium]|nr:hypothetical protein [bacterium]
AGLVLHLPKADRDKIATELAGKTREQLAELPTLQHPTLNFVLPRLVGVVRGVEPNPEVLVTGDAGAVPCHVSGGMAYAHWDKHDLDELGYTTVAARTDAGWKQRAVRARQLVEAERLWKSRAYGPLLDLVMQLPEDSTGERDLYRALAMTRLRQPDEAEKIFRALLDRLPANDPQRYEAHLQHAWNLSHLRRPFEQVADEFDRAIALAPANPAAYYAKGTLAYKQRKFGIAKEAYRKYLQVATSGRQHAEVSDQLANLEG